MSFNDLVILDVKTLFAILFWCNLISILINVIYGIVTKNELQYQLLRKIIMAKIFQASAYFLLFFRDNLWDILSVNLGNSFLFVGFYIEIQIIFEFVGNKRHYLKKTMIAVLCIAIVFFNIVEILAPDPNIRIATASIGVLAIIVIPSINLVLRKESTGFTRVIGGFYMIITALLLPRIILSFNNDINNLFSNSLVQSLTFLSLMLLNSLNSCALLLLMQEALNKINELLAYTDYLTKLPNRYSFLCNAEKIFDEHKKSDSLISLIFLDIDEFKNVNDKYGHQFGDEVLKKFSKVLTESLDEKALSCRYGGEEFVVFLPNSNYEDGHQITEKIMDAIKNIKFKEYPDFKFTMSAGIVTGIPYENDTLSGYLEVADKMLYTAKNNGRNCWEEIGFNDFKQYR